MTHYGAIRGDIKMKLAISMTVCILLVGMMYGCIEENREEENVPPACTLVASPINGTVPLTVTFTLTASDSDGNISSWKLDIDTDGNTEYSGTGTPPVTKVHIYDTPGSYSAQLIVTDNGGKTSSDTILITVNEQIIENQSPVCTLSVNPSDGYIPLMVTFSMNAYDPDGTIAYWNLDVTNDGIAEYFGSGNLSNTQSHTYTSTGTYIAKLTVIDNQGDTSTDTVTIRVTEKPPIPTVSISPVSQSQYPGTSVCVQVLINSDNAPVKAVNVKLTYPSNFTLTNFTSHKLLGSPALEVGIPSTPSNSGYIDYAQAIPGTTSPVAVNGNVATLCFTVASTPGTYTLDLTEVTLIDASGNPLTGFTPADGIIIITID